MSNLFSPSEWYTFSPINRKKTSDCCWFFFALFGAEGKNGKCVKQKTSRHFVELTIIELSFDIVHFVARLVF